jgi:CheY-like chemotaxis protein
VEPDAETRRALVELLAADGHDVRQAGRGIEFHRRLFELMRAPSGALLPSVVVVSLREPDRTIDRLCRFCVEEWKMPLVVLTGDTAEELERADRVGAMAVCTSGDGAEVRAAVSSAALEARRVAMG